MERYTETDGIVYNNYHTLVQCTAFKRPYLMEEVAETVESSIHETAQESDIRIISMQVDPNHIKSKV